MKHAKRIYLLRLLLPMKQKYTEIHAMISMEFRITILCWEGGAGGRQAGVEREEDPVPKEIRRRVQVFWKCFISQASGRVHDCWLYVLKNITIHWDIHKSKGATCEKSCDSEWKQQSAYKLLDELALMDKLVLMDE